MFFYDLFLGLIICFFSVFVYTYILYYLNDKRFRYLLFSLLLVGMMGLLLIYTRSLVSLIFLDIPILLGYLKEHEKDSILLSGLLLLLLSSVTPLPFIILLIKYIIYLVTFLLLRNKKKQLIKLLFSEKAFFLSFICFQIYSNNISIVLIYLLATILFLYLLMMVIINFLNLKSSNYSLEELETKKKIFRIAHEIKNPIAVCYGYLDMLDVTDLDKVNKYIPIVRSAINRALVIMDDFLSLSNIAIRNEILDIYLLIEDVYNTMEKLLQEKQVKLIVPKYNDELYIMGDYDRLKQVLVNIIKNAYEANSNRITITTNVTNKYVKIIIEDNGDGILPDNLKKVGEMFFTTKASGSGIGINLSKEIISLHNGEIKYDSVVDKGTRVMIKLPIEKGLN